MARIVFTVDTYPKQATNSTASKRVIMHGPPRPFHGIGKGKGGQEVRPPYYISPRLPSVSLSDDAESRAKRRAILNAVADAALRHNVTIPGGIEYRLPDTVEAQREDLLREIRRQDARDEQQAVEEQVRLELRRKAETSNVVFCGKCAKAIYPLKSGATWRWHAESCPERIIAWQAYVAANPWAKQGWQLRKEIALPKDAKGAPKEEAQLTKSDLAETFNAAADAIAEAKADRSQYMQAGDYSDQHK